MKFFVFLFLYHGECLRPRVPVSLSNALTELSRPHVFADRKDKACEIHRNCTCSAISQTKGKEKYWEVKRHDPAYNNQMGTELKFFWAEIIFKTQGMVLLKGCRSEGAREEEGLWIQWNDPLKIRPVSSPPTPPPAEPCCVARHPACLQMKATISETFKCNPVHT